MGLLRAERDCIAAGKGAGNVEARHGNVDPDAAVSEIAEVQLDQKMPFTDIRDDGWIARAPAALRPYLLLARLDRPAGIWLLFLPGAWGILLGAAPLAETLRLLCLFAIGATVMRAAGCVVNDLWDRDLDRQVRRTASRPLASGALGTWQALGFLFVLLMAGLCVLLQLDRLAQILGASSLLLVALYPLAKRVTWWPQLVMGFTFGVGAPVGYAAAAGRIDWAWAAIYAAAIFWDLGFDTIYGFQDIEDDAVVGVKSTSRRFAHIPRLFVGLAYGATLIALSCAILLARLSPLAWVVLALPAALLFTQVVQLTITDPATCLRLFKLNRETGLAIAAMLVAGRL
jgi:4-hydroxybenzoate polyprenyltransferase